MVRARSGVSWLRVTVGPPRHRGEVRARERQRVAATMTLGVLPSSSSSGSPLSSAPTTRTSGIRETLSHALPKIRFL